MNTMRSRYNYGSGKWNQGPNQSTCGRQKRCKHAAFTTKAAQSKARKPATRRNAPEVAIFFQSRMNLSSTATNVEDLLMQRLQLKHRFKPPLPAQSMGDHGRAPMEQMGQSKWVITVRAAEIHAKAVVAKHTKGNLPRKAGEVPSSSIEPLTFTPVCRCKYRQDFLLQRSITQPRK